MMKNPNKKPNYPLRRVIAATAVLAAGGITFNALKDNGESQAAPQKLEAQAVDTSFEVAALIESKVQQGNLIIREGTNLRHSPETDKVDSDVNMTENLAYVIKKGQEIRVTDPVVYKNYRDGNSYYGFTLDTTQLGKHDTTVPEEETSLYWVATETGGQMNEEINQFYTSFEPADPSDVQDLNVMNRYQEIVAFPHEMTENGRLHDPIRVAEGVLDYRANSDS